MYGNACAPPGTSGLTGDHDGATSREVTVDGTRLAVATVGRGPQTVVLLHGYVGSHRTWRHVLEPLSRRATIVAPDWFGWGASGCNPALDCTYDAEVERLARVLDVLGIDECSLAGHDYGGFLALGFCERHPGRVRRLAILNSRAHASFVMRWYVLFGALGWWARTPVLGAVLERLPLTRLHRRILAPGLRNGLFDASSLASYVDWMSNDRDGPAFFRRFHTDYSVAVRPELRARLGEIGCPTTIVWGERDPYLEVRIARELAAMIPDARLRLIAQAGHFVTEEAPAEVVDALQAWLDERPRPRGRARVSRR